jgi:hypothetical protein
MSDDKLDPGWDADGSWDGYPEEDRIEAARSFLRDFLQLAAIPDGLNPDTDGRAQWIEDSAGLLMGEGHTEWSRLVEEARQHPATFDVLSECAARFCTQGNALPPILGAWVADVLRGRNERPRQHGRHRGALYLRDAWLVHAVVFVAEFAGLNPTRNEATQGISACDLVAEILRDLEWKPELSAKTIEGMGNWEELRSGHYRQ